MNRSRSKSFSLDRLVKVGILASISYLLMFVQMPIPIAPPFMKIDLADVPALIGGFAMGSWYGVLIQLIKNVLNLSKTMTGGVGELSKLYFSPCFRNLCNECYSYFIQCFCSFSNLWKSNEYGSSSLC